MVVPEPADLTSVLDLGGVNVIAGTLFVEVAKSAAPGSTML